MMKKPFSRDALKVIAIIAMTLDHVAWFFVDAYMPAVGQIFHFIGRITAPVMCFFIAEGYRYSSDKKKYALRLLLFAIISQLPWWMVHQNFPQPSFNMMFTLLLSLFSIEVYERVSEKALKAFLICGIIYLTTFCDWHIYAVLWTLCFHIHRENTKKKFFWFSAVWLMYSFETLLLTADSLNSIPLAFRYSLYSAGAFVGAALIALYNGKKGKFQVNKWFFYCYYPLHILIIALIRVSV